MAFDQSTDPTGLSRIAPYQGLGLFETFDSPEHRNLLNANFRFIGDALQGIVSPSVLVVREVTSAYTTLIGDDVISATGTFAIELPPSSSAERKVSIKSVLGTITLTTNGSETIDGLATQLITTDASLTVAPVAAGWIII